MADLGLLVLAGIGWLLLELVLQIFLELLAAMGWSAVSTGHRRATEPRTWLAACWTAAGLIAGALTLLLLPTRITPPARILGISLVLSPLITGSVTHLLGRSWRERGRHPPLALTFTAGASFAFSIALARFVYIVLGWPSFQ